METMTAQTARELMTNSESYRLESVFSSIKASAKMGATLIYCYEKLNNISIQELQDKGFIVEQNCESIKISL